jgi:hypothetical protein
LRGFVNSSPRATVRLTGQPQPRVVINDQNVRAGVYWHGRAIDSPFCEPNTRQVCTPYRRGEGKTRSRTTNVHLPVHLFAHSKGSAPAMTPRRRMDLPRPSPHCSRTRSPNNAGLDETLVDGGPGTDQASPVHRDTAPILADGYPVRQLPSIAPLQAGIATGQVSTDSSRTFREKSGLDKASLTTAPALIHCHARIT